MNTFTIKGTEEMLSMTACVSSNGAEYTVALKHDYRRCCHTELEVTVRKNGSEKHASDSGDRISEGSTLTMDEIRLPSVRLSAIMHHLADPHRPAYSPVDESRPFDSDIAARIVSEADSLLGI